MDTTEQNLKTYMDRLTNDYPDRFVGSKGHGRAFDYIRDLLRSWGLWVEVQPFTVNMTVPFKWSLEVDLGQGFEPMDCLPGVGSPTVKKLEAHILPVGYAREEDYAELSGTRGKVHLARLWKSHETAKVSEASLHGASALLWYNEYFDELYSGASDYSLAPIPGVSIRRTDAVRIKAAGSVSVRLDIKSRRRKIRCRNLEAGRGDKSSPYAILASHYDSRPHTPGASDDASGVAVMLEYIRAGYDHDAALPMRFLFADCEEEGCIGAELFADRLYRENRLGDVAAVVNLDAVGWPNLCLITRDRAAVMDEELAGIAVDVLAGMDYKVDLVRSKSGKSNHTPFAQRGVKALWMSDYPNYIRHSAIDNEFNIDYPTMIMVTESLRQIFARMETDAPE
jgi:aminopeptidase YwaD